MKTNIWILVAAFYYLYSLAISQPIYLNTRKHGSIFPRNAGIIIYVLIFLALPIRLILWPFGLVMLGLYKRGCFSALNRIIKDFLIRRYDFIRNSAVVWHWDTFLWILLGRTVSLIFLGIYAFFANGFRLKPNEGKGEGE